MTRLRGISVVLLCALLPMVAMAQDRLVRLHAPEALVETGLLKYILPRFSLKTQIRVTLAEDPTQADMELGPKGRALFSGIGQTWHMQLNQPDHAGTKRLADWLTSEVGQRTVIAFAPDGESLFGPPQVQKQEVVAITMDGDAELGHKVARSQCSRCHQVDDETRMSGIGSTPSFGVLRSLNDWEDRFSTFYVLNPHPSFTIIQDLTEPFPEDRPSPIFPITLTLDEVEAMLAYVAVMKATDLGVPLAHQ